MLFKPMSDNCEIIHRRFLLLFIFLVLSLFPGAMADAAQKIRSGALHVGGEGGVEVLIGTFLGNEQRNFYGNEAPSKLDLIWKRSLGSGRTVISRRLGERVWAGAGWTGQPLLVREEGRLFLIQGAYDHHLKKIDATSGELVWQYKFDDVIKGTGTIWKNSKADNLEDGLVILQGSRLGVGNYVDSRHIPSFRAVSYFTGKELWRLDVKWTHSYSRDVDGSALLIDDRAYIGLENSLFTVLDPDHRSAYEKDGMLQPKILQETRLYKDKDVALHRNNVVTESSPALLDGNIYISSGSGHIFGYNLKKERIDWDFYVGSDMDGSPVVTKDNSIIVTIEKQYIDGPGGVFKLDPSKDPKEAVKWFFPAGDIKYSSWQGGVIGSVGVNDSYNDGEYPNLAAFAAIDGYLYIVDHTELDETLSVLGPDNKTKYHPPKLLFKKYIGPSISTPVIVGNRIIAAGYNGLYLFEFDSSGIFRLLDHMQGVFEATPIVWDGRVYIASRNGYLYCLGGR